MPVNEFEQQVQQKLEELQLQPSGEVWEEVEKRIQKEKKRRRVIFWWLFPLLLLGGGAAVYVFNDKEEKQTITEQNSNPQTTENSGSYNGTKDKTNNNELNNTNTSTNNENNPPASEQTTGINEEKIVAADKETKPVPAQSSAIAVTATGISKKKNTGVKTSSNRNSEENMLMTMVSAGKQKKDPPANGKTDPGDKIVSATEEIKIQPVADELKPAVTGGNDNIIAVDDKKDTAAQVLPGVKKEPEAEVVPVTEPTKKPKATNNKWEFGVHAAAGSSGISEGISFFDAQKSADALSSPGGQFNMAGPLAPVTAAAPQNSFYWQAGVYAKRKLSKKTAVSAGLDLSAYSTVRATGVFIETSRMVNNGLSNFTVADYYYSGTSYSYKNRYYFLQIPVSFHWQFNKGKKLPLEWQNGLSAGWMTSTNALVYSPASNVFFKDNSSFNKFQLSYQSGVTVRFFNKTKHPLTAGFVFNYHLTNLEKVKTTDGNHLTSFGLRLGWILKK